MSLQLLTRFGIGGAAGGGGGGEAKNVVTWDSVASNTAWNVRLGWQFTVGGSDVTVTALTHYGRAATAATWRVMIHRNSDNAVVASADIAKIENEWARAEITPVTLSAGVAYTVSGRVISGAQNFYINPTNVVVAPIVTAGSHVAGNASDVRPTGATGSTYYPVASFEYEV